MAHEIICDENVRGVLMGIDRNSATPYNAEASNEYEDDIPF